MERWGIAINDVYKTASIQREVGPWYLFFLEWLTDFLCGLVWKLPSIKLPKWHVCKYCFLGNDLLEENEVTTLREEYYDVATLICRKVHDPIMQWCYRRYEHTRMKVDIVDAAVFSKWVRDVLEDSARDAADGESMTDDPWHNHPKFTELEDTRQQIFDLWDKRDDLVDELVDLRRKM